MDGTVSVSYTHLDVYKRQIWAGQAVSLITSAILQMAIIFYLTEKTGSAMVL